MRFIAPRVRHIIPPHSKSVIVGFPFTLPAYPSIGSECILHLGFSMHLCKKVFVISITPRPSDSGALNSHLVLSCPLYAPALGSFLASLRGKCDISLFRFRIQNSSYEWLVSRDHRSLIWPTNMVCATFIRRADHFRSIGGQFSPLGRSTVEYCIIFPVFSPRQIPGIGAWGSNARAEYP